MKKQKIVPFSQHVSLLHPHDGDREVEVLKGPQVIFATRRFEDNCRETMQNEKA
jgi:hypothetical protein